MVHSTEVMLDYLILQSLLCPVTDNVRNIYYTHNILFLAIIEDKVFLNPRCLGVSRSMLYIEFVYDFYA